MSFLIPLVLGVLSVDNDLVVLIPVATIESSSEFVAESLFVCVSKLYLVKVLFLFAVDKYSTIFICYRKLEHRQLRAHSIISLPYLTLC